MGNAVRDEGHLMADVCGITNYGLEETRKGRGIVTNSLAAADDFVPSSVCLFKDGFRREIFGNCVSID